MSIAQKLKRLFGTKDPESMTLTELVTLVADEPTRANLEWFYRRLLVSKVGARIPNPHGSIQPGTRQTSAHDNFGIRTHRTRRATAICSSFVTSRPCSKPSRRTPSPSWTLASCWRWPRAVPWASSFRTSWKKRLPWAGVLRADVADVLAGRYSNRQ